VFCLNFPVGSVLSKGDSPFDFVSKAWEFAEKQFNGYVILSVSGHYIEEGAVFFKEGELIGCIVECLAVGKTIKGVEALPYFYNETQGAGFYHCVELSKSQVDLVTAFDEKILVPKINLKELANSIPSAFSPKFERLEAQKSVLDTYGLGGLK
jgi:hypothetical protein